MRRGTQTTVGIELRRATRRRRGLPVVVLLGTVAALVGHLLSAPEPARGQRLAGPPGGGQVAVLDPLNDPRRPLFAAFRRPDGAFAPQQRLAPAGNCCSSVAANARGDAIAVWRDPRGAFVAVRSRKSNRFSRARRLEGAISETPTGERPQVALNSRGDAVVAWQADAGYVTSWRPAGGTFADPQLAPLASAQLALTDAGQAVLVGTGATAGAGSGVAVLWATSDRGGPWAAPEAVSVPVREDYPEYLATSVAPSGAALIVWRDLESATWRGAERAPAGAFRPVDAPIPGSVGYETPPIVDVAVGDQGHAVLAYLQGAEKIAVRTRVPGGRWTRAQVLPGRTDDYYSLASTAVDARGNVATAHWSSSGLLATYGPAGRPLKTMWLQRGRPFEALFGPTSLDLWGSDVYVLAGAGRATASWQTVQGDRIQGVAADFSSRGPGRRLAFASVSFTRIGPASACRPRGSHTIADTRLVRVYETRADEETVELWACMYRRGAPLLLDSDGTPGDWLLAARGSFVAYPQAYWNYEAEMSSATIAVHDLSNDRAEYLSLEPSFEYEDSSTGVTDIVVSARGSTAWILSQRGSRGGYEVVRHRAGRDESERLAQGSDIEPRSLRLTGERLSWVAGGRRHWATLR